MDDKKQRLCFWTLILFAVAFLYFGNLLATTGNLYFAGESASEDYYRARVLTASPLKTTIVGEGEYAMETQTVSLTARLLSGFMAGEEITITDQRVDNASPAYHYPYRAGDKIFVTFSFDENDEPVWFALDHLRSGWLAVLVLAFLALLVLFGRKKGLYTVITLVFTTAAVFLVMIPAIIKGVNIIALTFIIATFIIITTLGIVSGVSRKSAAAAVGCIGGVAVAGLIAAVMQRLMRISGFVDEDSSFVMLINTQTPISLRGVLFGAIIIGALGAVMDVAMSIASSLDELIAYTPNITTPQLIQSGLNIGRDIIGTMANTLILAYVGSSLNVILLLMAYNHSLDAVLNREMVAIEVLQAVAGSTGILCAVPCTTFVTAALCRRSRQSAA